VLKKKEQKNPYIIFEGSGYLCNNLEADKNDYVMRKMGNSKENTSEN